MYYGIEQSTDMRDRRTVIKKFNTETALQKWLTAPNQSGRYTYEDPHAARNCHRSFRRGYKLEGRINKKDPIFTRLQSYTYWESNDDRIALYVRAYGDLVETKTIMENTI